MNSKSPEIVKACHLIYQAYLLFKADRKDDGYEAEEDADDFGKWCGMSALSLEQLNKLEKHF